MTEENLINLKNKYQEMNEINNNLSILLEKKEGMESLEIVKQYLQILKRLEDYQKNLPVSKGVLTKDELLESVIKSEAIKSTNKIYVYQCSFAKFNYGTNKQVRGYDRVAVDNPNAEYHVYLDIEKDYQQAAVEVSSLEREEFEKNNKVIYPGENQYAYDCYLKLKKDFYQTAINYNQEEAIQKVCKR